MADETHDKREQFRELLEEVRVVIPGTQVLFAFLLTAPFSGRFAQLEPDERTVFGVALLATATATIFLIAPTVYHRMRRRQSREERLRASVAMAMVGILSLAVGVTAAVRVIVGFVWGDTASNAATAFVTVVIVGLWYVFPLTRRAGGDTPR